MTKTITLALTLLALAITLTGCGGGDGSEESKPVAPATTAATSFKFTDKAAFEQYVKEWTIRTERERYDADLTVSNIDCIKSGATTAKCVIDGSTPVEGDVQLKADVTCQDSKGNDCLIEVEPLR